MKRILFTGGGSAGHVTVNLALIPKFLGEGWDVSYIGSETGIEKQLIAPIGKVRYYSIATGKLRRYFDWNNVKDPFKVVKGVFQAYQVIRRQKPDVIFSKGGFVSVPVVLGAWLHRVPVVIHESDLTPGLANRIAIPFATRVCVTFPETVTHLHTHKATYAGAIVREELLRGNATRGLIACHFIRTKPILLVMGGSLGSQRINQAIRSLLDTLLADFQIVHICGKGQVDTTLATRGYVQYEYVQHELPDILAMSDLVISRAGSNAIFEFLSLRKPMLLIPLPKGSSRGDQIINARSFASRGYCEVLPDELVTNSTLLAAIYKLRDKKNTYIENMEKSEPGDPLHTVMTTIKKATRQRMT